MHADQSRSLFLELRSEEVAVDNDYDPEVEIAREYVIVERAIAAGEVELGFDYIEEATRKTGLAS